MDFLFVRVGVVAGLQLILTFPRKFHLQSIFIFIHYKAFTLLNLQLVDYGLHKSIAFRHAVLLNSSITTLGQSHSLM